MINAWTNGLATVWDADGKITLWSLIRGGFSALITEFGIIVGYIVLPFSLAIFAACYVFWGCILYVVGPLVLATMPSSTLGTVSLALDRESVCLELLAAVGKHAVEPHDSGSSE